MKILERIRRGQAARRLELTGHIALTSLVTAICFLRVPEEMSRLDLLAIYLSGACLGFTAVTVHAYVQIGKIYTNIEKDEKEH
jgi:hypothetical protein